MKNKNVMTPWERFVGLIKLEKRDILQVIYYAVFSGILSLTLPLGIQAIINLLQGAQVSTSWVVLVILVTLGVAFVGVLQLMQLRIIETIQQRIFMRASFEFTYRFPKIKMSELRNQYPPELANRFFDILNIQKGLAKILVDIPAAILQIVFALILLSFYHPFFIAFGILLLVLIYVVFKFTAQSGMDTSLVESKYKYKVAHWIQEVARAIVSFKLSGQTSLAINKNDALVNDYLESREKHFRILVIQFMQMVGFKVLVTAGLLLIGGLLVLNQEMNIGQFVAAEIIILLVITSVEKLILRLESFYDVLTSLEKMGQVVDKKMESQEGDKPHFNGRFNIELSNVSYGVPNRELHILKNISLKIGTDCKLLITGESGSGKSSLLRLIGGVVEPTKGRVFINDYDLKNININHYRSHVGLSLSDETPFEATIRENITFGNENISEEQLLWAINKVELNAFVKESPKGLNTILNPEGKQTSYTITKKIALARAIVNKPKILILEDPLEYFEDDESERIVKFLTDPTNPWALVVVSKSDQWKTHCTQIVTLKKGQII
ncbi:MULTISPECIES: peptidase domain-containing ABC transporter [Winogradskyella]|uniref:ABC-type bacteriocin/lantibiotic exporter with double-glycine peptidase domain n=2 Tax=Winogradskyella TaxID=286104 RepID=A0A368ZDH1_9FLAO|nr:ATP-binding cassette domain-containing protein [Winogradskyella arenosi]RCW89941.1 ABC-type bacteriocin/lantibiotic exporter with double-glycine peptidase domain [Winogradskyella arenosi]